MRDILVRFIGIFLGLVILDIFKHIAKRIKSAPHKNQAKEKDNSRKDA